MDPVKVKEDLACSFPDSRKELQHSLILSIFTGTSSRTMVRGELHSQLWLHFHSVHFFPEAEAAFLGFKTPFTLSFVLCYVDPTRQFIVELKMVELTQWTGENHSP